MADEDKIDRAPIRARATADGMADACAQAVARIRAKIDAPVVIGVDWATGRDRTVVVSVPSREGDVA